ncbi:MAG: hypothetical protein JO293_01645 [Candidatus Eremiobacteraeota bacterium]|nr:hypothetical protein [Candidatus Eremiobacteraeota bacterium]
MSRTASPLWFASLLCAAMVLSTAHLGARARAASSSQPQPHLRVVNMDLDFRPKTRPVQGKLLGYDPAVVNVHIGDRIQFVNVDDVVHTATGFTVSGQKVPTNYKFTGDATVARGHVISLEEWSTGTLRAHGGKSQVFVTKTTGNFYFGCAYHLGSGMRGVIVVTP